ncbi:hypothetical protein [Candidatus Halobonum tyrrellensis]|uniref:Uncharacterized protein n=1 Tax=Candidatus Halobonum tyrrellensis G22 TaxID=1324957 RepID=V4HCH5_9EURY|nr:hypothetical protein [Candidatus Halobonum tyrrellensis]ESP88385.1 hypothetical protein K933_09687 [Candidatus Halobonum tyrrellensis G22]
MDLHSLPAAVRRHPSATFGVVGGLFALAYLLAASDGPVDDRLPVGPEAFLVVGGFLGGALVSWALWGRLGAADSPRRGAAAGALVGLLALPVPFYLLELGVIAFEGSLFDPGPGSSPLARAAEHLFLLVGTPLLLGAFGLVVTCGGTVVAGAAAGYLLARR